MKAAPTLQFPQEIPQTESVRVDKLCDWIEKTMKKHAEQMELRLFISMHDPLYDYIFSQIPERLIR